MNTDRPTVETNDKRREGKPYIWPTWITGLLAGTNACWWQAWYKAHFKYEKRRDDRGSVLDEWTKTHDAMVTARAKALTDAGYFVGVEDDNEFRLDGKIAVLSGKPDIVARGVGSALVVDEKSGKERDSDLWQVRIYLFALPIADEDFRGIGLRGQVEYRNNRYVDVDLGPVDGAHIANAVKIVGGEAEPARVPSARDCRFCDIVACPDRHKDRVADASAYF